MKGTTVAGGAFLAFGLLGVYSLADEVVTLVLPARDWEMVSLENLDEGFEFRLDGLSTISPRYTYAYRGRIYEGTRLNFEPGPWFESDWDRPEPLLHAFVNPNNPSESVLQRTIPRWRVKSSLKQMIALPFGVWLVWPSARSRRKSSCYIPTHVD
jgi:hypothetical protein